MESFFSRYRNLIVLLATLLLQVIGLAVQVRKTGPPSGAMPTEGRDRPDGKSVRLIRLWAADLVMPFERGVHGAGQQFNDLWENYIDLRHTRDDNKNLQQTIDRLRLEQASLLEDARQGQRLQALLDFRQKYVYTTVPAQVIGTSGSSLSHVIWLDKGSADGLAPDMAVITSGGIVGKVREVFSHTSQVLEINDQSSGAGVVLEKTRTRGILRGDAGGRPQVINILADQRIQPGERVLTAGGDQIFPRGLPVGVVEQVVKDPERGSFIDVIVKPAADLQHLDEVLVITAMDTHLSPEQQKDVATSEELKGAEVAAAEAERKKAAAEMAERLPSLKDPNAPQPAAGETKPEPSLCLPCIRIDSLPDQPLLLLWKMTPLHPPRNRRCGLGQIQRMQPQPPLREWHDRGRRRLQRPRLPYRKRVGREPAACLHTR
jgi:rod shape-determining protein MreC